MFKIRAVLASLLSPVVGHLRRLRAVRARGPPGRRGVPGQREVPSCARATGPAAERGGRVAGPVPHPAQRDPAGQPGPAAGCATCASTTSTTTRCCAGPSATRRRATRCSSSARFDSRDAQWANTTLDMPALGLDWHERIDRPRRADRRRPTTGASATPSASTRTSSPRTSSPCTPRRLEGDDRPMDELDRRRACTTRTPCWARTRTGRRRRRDGDPHPAARAPATVTPSWSASAAPDEAGARRGRLRGARCPATVADYRVEVDGAARRRPVPAPADPRRAGPAPDRRGPARAALWTVLGARVAVRRAGSRSRSGRPTPAAYGWSATSPAGAARRAGRCARSGAAGCGSCSCRTRSPGSATSTGSSARDGVWREKADPLARVRRGADRPPRRWSSSSALRVGRRRLAGRRGRAGEPHREPMSIYEVHLGSWRPGLSYRELAEQLTAYVVGPGLHPRGVHAGDGAPVRRLVGLPGDRLLRADRPVRRPGRVPPPRRHACTRPASA